MKKMFFTTVFLTFLIFNAFSQDSIYDAKYDLTISTTTRDADAILMIKDSTGNIFTGIFLIDDFERRVFGWYIQKISEGGQFKFNTEGMVFYCELEEGFPYQQLFKGIFNFDKSYISGTYFFWGNEFIFQGNKTDMQTAVKSQKVLQQLRVYPIPVDDYLTIDSKSVNNEIIEIYDISGRIAIRSTYTDRIHVSTLKAGTYILILRDTQGRSEKIKFIKR